MQLRESHGAAAVLFAGAAALLKGGLGAVEHTPAALYEAPVMAREVRYAVPEDSLPRAVRACRGALLDQLVPVADSAQLRSVERAVREVRCSRRVVSRENR